MTQLRNITVLQTGSCKQGRIMLKQKLLNPSQFPTQLLFQTLHFCVSQLFLGSLCAGLQTKGIRCPVGQVMDKTAEAAKVAVKLRPG